MKLLECSSTGIPRTKNEAPKQLERENEASKLSFFAPLLLLAVVAAVML